LKILFVHEVNYLTKPIFEMHEFPEHLAALGHDVGFVQFPEGESDSTVAAIPFRQLVRGRVLQEQRLTLYTPKTASGGLLGRLIAVFSFKAQFIRVLNDFEPDVVVSFSVPTSGWQAVQACKKLGVPLLFRALDVSHKIRRSFFSPLVGLAEKFIYKNADWVSANNPAMLAYVRANGAKFERSKVNFPPLDLIHFDRAREAKTEMRTELGIPQMWFSTWAASFTSRGCQRFSGVLLSHQRSLIDWCSSEEANRTIRLEHLRLILTLKTESYSLA
jgi:hypothetical protein